MKRLSFLFGLLIIVSTFVPVYGIEFDVEIEPGKTFVHPDDGLTYYKANTDFYLDLKIGGEAGQGDLGGFCMLFRLYAKINGIETDDIPITWIDAGGTDLNGSVTRMNGWEDATYWGMLNEVDGLSWDGSLPDTISHVTASMTGMTDTEPLLTRFRFHFNVPNMGIDPLTDIIEICIDAANSPEPYGGGCWDFPFSVDFGGPYCFPFLGQVETPPTVINPPVLTTPYGTPYNLNCIIQHDDWIPLSNVCAIDENDNPIGTATIFNESFLNWTFDPPCSWINDGENHYVFFYVESEAIGLYCPESERTHALLTVTAETPVISGNCGMTVASPIGHTATAEFEVTNPNSGEINWSLGYSSVPVGNVELIDGVLSFSPCPEDETGGVMGDGFFTFTVNATNCLGEYDQCNVTMEMIAGCWWLHDPNGDGNIDILDIVFVINYKYKDGPAPSYPPSSDWNLDGAINILDVVYIINFKYKDGPFAKHDLSHCSK